MIATRERTPTTATAFDRLGGFDVLALAVGKFIARLPEIPALQPFAVRAAQEDARWQFQLLLTDLLGGPMSYEGPDPATVRALVGLDGEGFDAAARLLTASCAEAGASSDALEGVRGVLAQFRRRVGLDVPARTSSFADLVTRAETMVTERHLDCCNLFVLDTHYTVVYVSPEAARSATAVDSDLRRAFGLGAGDIQGTSLLRFHPAPTQLQGLLSDLSGNVRETTWCFGRATWRASIFAIIDLAGQHRGFAVPWRDETEATRIMEIFRRLRSEAEELPVPLMYPDLSRETWHGNAACESALERLKPYLPFPVNPLEGIPARLFFPDLIERRALFRDPARLPHKVQIPFGPEMVSVLVSPVLDQDQRYIGPQITWEIIYYTRAASDLPLELPVEPVVLLPEAASDTPAARPVDENIELTAARLQDGARVLARVGAELQQLATLVESVAGLTVQGEAEVVFPAELPAADLLTRQVNAAIDALALARQGTRGSHPGVSQALEQLGSLARHANLVAVQSAAEVLREDAHLAAHDLAAAVQDLSSSLAERVAGAMATASTTADALTAVVQRAGQLQALRATVLEQPQAGDA